MSTLTGIVRSASPGLLGFDADSVISGETAAQFQAAGYSFCARYLSLGDAQQSGDLSNAEAQDILNSGLALVAVQHVREPGWSPTARLGGTDGANAASNAASIGLPQGMNIWCDLEGVQNQASAADVIGYCGAWYAAVLQAGYAPGLYVGANCVLTGAQLYDLPFQHYWRSLSDVPELPNRGYQMLQSAGNLMFGVRIDRDTTQTDNQGGNVLWVAKP